MKRFWRLMVCVGVALSVLAGMALAGARTLEDCEHARIGVVTGSLHDSYVKKYFPDAEVLYFSSYSDMTAALLSGNIDTFPSNLPKVWSMMEANPEITYIDEPLDNLDIGFAFAKNDAGAALRDEMNAFLVAMEADGRMDALRDKWLHSGADDYDVDVSDLVGGERVIRLATACQGKPDSYFYNNKPTGYELELVAMFCRERGYGLDIRVVDFAGIIPGLVSGEFDIGADSIAITAERAESVHFSSPMYNMPINMVTLKDEMATMTTLDDFRKEGVALGVVTGMISDQYYAEMFPDAEVKYYNNEADIIFALQSGQIDGYMDDDVLIKYVSSHVDGLAHIDEPAGKPMEVAYVLAKTEFGDTVRAQFSDYIRRAKEDGTVEELIELWCGTDESRQVIDIPTEGENGTIKVCASAETAPASFILNEKLAGFEVDLLVRFAKEYGYGLDIDAMDFTGILSGVASGIYDIGFSYLSVTDERKITVNFSEPYHVSKMLMMVRGDTAAEEPGFWSGVRASFERTFLKESRWRLIVQGIGTTMVISICAAILGTLLGFGLCMLRRLRNPVVHGFTTVYIRALQGTPLLVLLMILYYLVFASMGLSGELVAIFAFALNFAAYVCEMFRTGIDGVDKGQTEASLALGYTKSQTFFRIILPQAAESFLPVYKGEFISLVKMTSVVGYIAVQDLTKMSDIIRSRTYEAFFPLIATALIYFILSALLTGLLKTVEIKVKPNRRNRMPKGVTKHD